MGNLIPPHHHYLDHAICLLNALPVSTLAPHFMLRLAARVLLKDESDHFPPGLTSPMASTSRMASG